MAFHGLHDLVADGLQGVQAGHGVLHDHGAFSLTHLKSTAERKPKDLT